MSSIHNHHYPIELPLKQTSLKNVLGITQSLSLPPPPIVTAIGGSIKGGHLMSIATHATCALPFSSYVMRPYTVC